jgi:hypothetical protein
MWRQQPPPLRDRHDRAALSNGFIRQNDPLPLGGLPAGWGMEIGEAAVVGQGHAGGCADEAIVEVWEGGELWRRRGV